MINASTTYTAPGRVVTTTAPGKKTYLSEVYPGGVLLPLGVTAVGFNPPQRGQKGIAADRLKGKTRTGADSRVVTFTKNNPADSSPRVIVQ